MALIFLIVNIFGSLNIQIDAVFPSESTCVIGSPVGYIVKELSLTSIDAL